MPVFACSNIPDPSMFDSASYRTTQASPYILEPAEITHISQSVTKFPYLLALLSQFLPAEMTIKALAPTFLHALCLQTNPGSLSQ